MPFFLFLLHADGLCSYFSTFIMHQEDAARMIDGVALTYEHRSPAGVFTLISPWNMPCKYCEKVSFCLFALVGFER